MSRSKKTDIIDVTAEESTSAPKKRDWRSKGVAPGTWVDALFEANQRPSNEGGHPSEPKDDATDVLIYFRSGRRGAEMLVDSLPWATIGRGVGDSLLELAGECWSRAREKRAEMGDDRRYDAMIKVVEVDEAGHAHVSSISGWAEVEEDFEDMEDPIAGFGGKHQTSEAWGLVRVLSGQNRDLFRANISLVRASGWLLREAIAGQVDRFNSDTAKLEAMSKMAGEMADMKMEVAKQEGDAAELQEFGKTARQWMALAHEDKLAERGVKTPEVPNTRGLAAKALRQSITLAQLEALSEKLGPDRTEKITGLLANAPQLSEDQIGQLIDGELADVDAKLELWSAVEKVFSEQFVPSTWAIWQMRCLRVVVEGPIEAAA